MITFYSNNATNLHHLSTQVRVVRVDLQNGDRIATTDMWRHFTLCILLGRGNKQ